jgi:hypothetical protein
MPAKPSLGAAVYAVKQKAHEWLAAVPAPTSSGSSLPAACQWRTVLHGPSVLRFDLPAVSAQ